MNLHWRALSRPRPDAIPQGLAGRPWRAGPGGAHGQSGQRRPRRRAPADNPMAVRPPHSRPRPSTSSICTCRVRRRSRTCSTTSPSWSSTTSSPAPTRCSRTSGSRSSRGIPSCSARRTSSPRCGQSGAWVSEILPEFRTRGRRGLRWCSRCTPTSSTTRRPSCFFIPARRATAARRWGRGSPMGWARRARTCPASS